ncbi:MAG: hypothetical protein JO369_02985 [Paucibacter sp.]|nr:hypothetical protein [Roseateles sp.]
MGQIAWHVADTDCCEVFYSVMPGLSKPLRFSERVVLECTSVRLMLEGGKPTMPPDEGVCPLQGQRHPGRANGAEHAGRGLLRCAAHLIARLPDRELCMCFLKDLDGQLVAPNRGKEAR